jgi:hypothetical protein
MGLVDVFDGQELGDLDGELPGTSQHFFDHTYRALADEFGKAGDTHHDGVAVLAQQGRLEGDRSTKARVIGVDEGRRATFSKGSGEAQKATGEHFDDGSFVSSGALALEADHDPVVMEGAPQVVGGDEDVACAILEGDEAEATGMNGDDPFEFGATDTGAGFYGAGGTRGHGLVCRGLSERKRYSHFCSWGAVR